MTNINSLDKFGVYERKSVRQKSSDCRDKNIKINLLQNFDNNDRNSSSRNDNESHRLINKNNNIKLDKNYLQKSINETKIFFNNINEKKYNRAKDFINKPYLTSAFKTLIERLVKSTPPITSPSNGIKILSTNDDTIF
jgi:hypothetical protein